MIRKIFVGVMVIIIIFSNLSLMGYETPDRAIRIIQQNKQKVEQSGKILKKTTDEFGKEFAEKIGEIQFLINLKRDLERQGELDQPRRQVIDGQILVKLGELKKITDKHLPSLLSTLDYFDRTVAEAVIDTQAARSINTDYKFNYKQYLEMEKRRFDETYRKAEEVLRMCNEGNENACERYRRIRMRLERMAQRKALFDMRIRVATLNQIISEKIRNTIKNEGGAIGSKFRNTLKKLYLVYLKATPLVYWWRSNEGFSVQTLEKLSSNLQILDDSIEKLLVVIDRIVDNLLRDLSNVKELPQLSDTKILSTEEELKRLSELKVVMEKSVAGGEEE